MGKEYKTVLLDLDGTIIDSGAGITRSVQYALKALGIETEDLKQLYPFIGPPLHDSFREFSCLNEQQTAYAVSKYRERYEREGIHEYRLYEGMRETLQQWHSRQVEVMLCTSKPEKFARMIMEETGLTSYFTFIGGATLDGKRVTKHEVIEYVLESCRITDRSRVVMVGDRKYDIAGARQSGLDAAGVLYGYGSREELVAAGADYIVKNVADLRKLIG